MSDRITSYLRTAVPLAWGWAVSQLVLAVPGLPVEVVDLLRSDAMVTAVSFLVALAWYFVWRRLEPHLPDWATRLVLGSASAPVYVKSDEHAVVAPRDVVIVAEPNIKLEG